jgi:ABC-type transport system substrate-binding protein
MDLVWTFYLRQNAKCPMVHPIDAENIAYSWRRALAKETPPRIMLINYGK